MKLFVIECAMSSFPLFTTNEDRAYELAEEMDDAWAGLCSPATIVAVPAELVERG